MGARTPPGGLTSDNPFKKHAEKSRFFWGGIANSAQVQLNEERQNKLGKSTPSKSLVTGGGQGKRKRIYGMGKTTKQQPSGTVTKPKLGGN